MFGRIRHLLEMIRFSHTLFALPPALLGAAMAWAANRQDALAEPFRWQDLLGMRWLQSRKIRYRVKGES